MRIGEMDLAELSNFLLTRKDPGSFDLWGILATSLIGFGGAKPEFWLVSAETKRVWDPFRESGLVSFLESIEKRIEDKDFSVSNAEVLQGFKLSDRFVELYFADRAEVRPVTNAERLRQTYTNGSDDPATLSTAREHLFDTSDYLPESVAEWRRKQYLYQVGLVLDLASYVIGSRNVDLVDRVQFKALWSNAGLQQAFERARQLVSDVNTAVTSQELADWYALSREIIHGIGLVEETKFKKRDVAAREELMNLLRRIASRADNAPFDSQSFYPEKIRVIDPHASEQPELSEFCARWISLDVGEDSLMAKDASEVWKNLTALTGQQAKAASDVLEHILDLLYAMRTEGVFELRCEMVAFSRSIKT